MQQFTSLSSMAGLMANSSDRLQAPANDLLDPQATASQPDNSYAGTAALLLLLVTLVTIFGAWPNVAAKNAALAAEPAAPPAPGTKPVSDPTELKGAELKGAEPKLADKLNADSPLIDYHQARDYVGKNVAVEITVTQTGNIGKICFLNVDNAREFTVPLFSETFKDVPEGAKPEKFYLKKKLRVSGKVTLYKGKPQIEVHDLKQIQVLDEAATAKSDPPTTQKPSTENLGNVKPATPTSFQHPHLKPELASGYLGKSVVIEGIVDRSQKKDGGYHFDFGAYPPEEVLTVAIPKELVTQFPRDPEGLFLYQHVLVSGEIETVDKKMFVNIKQPDQIRLDLVSGKVAHTKVLPVDEALTHNGEYLGVQGTVEGVDEGEHFYTVKLQGTNGKIMKIAVDKICLPRKEAKSELASKPHTYYGKILADGKAAQMIIGDQREIVPEATLK
jgi:hypothetical protein